LKRFALGLSLAALAALSLASCDMLHSMTGISADSETVDANTPAIPLPTSATDEPPQTSDELITDSKDIENFSVYLSSDESDEPEYINVLEGDDGDIYRIASSAYYSLIENGELLGGSSPVWQSVSGTSTVQLILHSIADFPFGYFNPYLQEIPLIQRVVYWKRLICTTVEYPNDFTQTYTYTYGSSSTETTELAKNLTVTLGSDAWASLSASLTETFSKSLTVSEESTDSKEFGCSSIQGKKIVFTVWQLVERYQIVNRDGTAWCDSNYGSQVSAATVTNRLQRFYTSVVKFKD
jgi:hypothetical protein